LGFFPLLNFYAFYRIGKIFHGLAIVFGVSVVVAITTGMILGLIMIGSNPNFEDFQIEEEQTIESIGNFMAYLISTGFAINFLRKWSKQWNEKLSYPLNP
jgi:hypothetical protein